MTKIREAIEEAIAVIKKLKPETYGNGTIVRLQDALSHLSGEPADKQDADKRDAERYRLLRNRAKGEDIGRITASIAVRRLPPNDWVVDSVYGEEMDAAIDQAMKEGK